MEFHPIEPHPAGKGYSPLTQSIMSTKIDPFCVWKYIRAMAPIFLSLLLGSAPCRAEISTGAVDASLQLAFSAVSKLIEKNKKAGHEERSRLKDRNSYLQGRCILGQNRCPKGTEVSLYDENGALLDRLLLGVESEFIFSGLEDKSYSLEIRAEDSAGSFDVAPDPGMQNFSLR
jgi:hypothetical protein